MTSNKKRKRYQEIDSFEFEKFARTHLPIDLVDTLILHLGIKTYTGFLQCDDLNSELLVAHNSIPENNRSYLFLYDNLHSSSATAVKPCILRELKIFQEYCEKQLNSCKTAGINSGNSSSTQGENEPHDISKRSKNGCNIDRPIIFSTRLHDSTNNNTFKYRTKPTSNEENNTDWSFENDEAHEYDQNHFNDSFSDEFVIKEATHIYVTQQRIHHFFKNKMQIEAEDIQKFVYMLQYGQAWHLEQVYEFTMKLRSNKVLLDKFMNDFKNNDFENNDIKKKIKWLMDFITKSEYSKEANIPIDQSESKIRKTPSVKGYRTKTEQQLEICDQAINLSRISNKNKAFFYSFS
ncbi:unnamed protein product [Rotaria sordida]|uniref:Uncharacterized protein n=1 Tax=Rotaria sordida TaxID=392033 RepID=A0A814LXW7_9BILA|nr:unnamed protein product [Rotaria sordida]CAF1253761.1 unnamed protein product [Rotaria sordida]